MPCSAWYQLRVRWHRMHADGDALSAERPDLAQCGAHGTVHVHWSLRFACDGWIMTCVGRTCGGLGLGGSRRIKGE
eukprot:3919151-Prymnesium_polylepis.2